MMKTAVICSMVLVFSASAQILEFDNNFIEYGPAPVQSISLPYPYHNGRDKTVVLEPVAAPAYSYSYGNIVPTTTEVESAGFISTAISCAFDAARSVLVFFLTNGPALLAGSIVALGLCKLTSLCDSQVTIYEAQTELRSLATPERLSRAANFLKDAVKKYSEMQKN